MYPAGFWKHVLFPTPLFLSVSFAGGPSLPGCIGTAFYSHLYISRCSPGLCWEHIPALFTGSSGKPEDSVSLDGGLSQDHTGKAQSCTYSSPQSVPNCVLALLRIWCVIPMNSGILTAKAMTVKIKHVACKETIEHTQGQPVFHLTERTIPSLLVFLEAMSVLLFILCLILNIHCSMSLNAYLYLWLYCLSSVTWCRLLTLILIIDIQLFKVLKYLF